MKNVQEHISQHINLYLGKGLFLGHEAFGKVKHSANPRRGCKIY